MFNHCMAIYKTSEEVRRRAKEKRDRIKAKGGDGYEELLARERAARAEYRARHPETIRAERRRHEKTRPGYHKKRLVIAARRRGRKAGRDATIKVSDLVWPTHCPILGIELDYTTKPGLRNGQNPANPSLDRWDNSRGYVIGNVFVISYRANTLKNNATPEELEAIAAYVRHGLAPLVAID